MTQIHRVQDKKKNQPGDNKTLILQRLQDGAVIFPGLRLSEEILLIQTKVLVCVSVCV